MKSAILALVILCLVVAGCQTTPLNQAKVLALTSKQTAETAYLTLRIQFELGNVAPDVAMQASMLYAQWKLAQDLYVDALEIWETGGVAPDNLPALRAQVILLAQRLQALVGTLPAEDTRGQTNNPVDYGGDGRADPPH